MRVCGLRLHALGLISSLAWSTVAHAQPVAPAAEPAAPAPASAPTADAVKEAAERYQRGLATYGDGEYLLALVEFERAYQLAPNYRVLYNIGQVRIQLGRSSKAIEALQAYLEQGGSEINAERRASVEKDLKTLLDRTAKLHVASSETGAEILVDGVSVGKTPLTEPITVDAGEHTVLLRKDGFYDKSSFVSVAGREDADVKIELVPVPTARIVERPSERPIEQKPDRTLIWVGWATTGTLAVTAGVVGYFGITKANDLESERTDYGITPEQLANDKSSARKLLMIADITGAAALVVGGVSLYLTLSSKSHEAPSHAPPPSRVGLRFGPTNVQLDGTF